MKIFLTRFRASALSHLWSDADGQGLTEYALMLVLIAIVAIAALTFLGGDVTSELSTIGNSVT